MTLTVIFTVVPQLKGNRGEDASWPTTATTTTTNTQTNKQWQAH